MTRGCVTYSIVFIAGILSVHLCSPSFPITATLLALLLALAYTTRKRALMFLTISHIALFVAGVQSGTLSKGKENLPPDKLSSSIQAKSGTIRLKCVEFIGKITDNPENKVILCALTIGEKGDMERGFRESWSKAGAMHLLALSGLHVGIIYAISDSLLSILGIFPIGGVLRWGISILFLLGYMVISGCSPSVVRACTMIFIYKLSQRKFRDTGKWDAIAIAALITGVLAPWQVTSIGFQLSYAAVAGIAALYPVCRRAFVMCAEKWGTTNGAAYGVFLNIWECISISICCQIATLPLLIIYFGGYAQHFLLTNLVAIPLVTGILYLFVMLVSTHWLPYASDFLTWAINVALTLLHSWINFISG